MPTARMRRVNEVLREVVGEAVSNDLGDPRVGLVTITSVDTSPDLRSAKVYFTVLGGEEEREEAQRALTRAHGIIQGRVAQETHMKRTPKLRFEYDEAIESGLRISRLLEEPEPTEPTEPEES